MMRTGCHRHMRSTAWRAREALRGGRACVPVILVNGHRNCTWAAAIQRLLSRPRDDGAGSYSTIGRRTKPSVLGTAPSLTHWRSVPLGSFEAERLVRNTGHRLLSLVGA